MPAKEAVTSMDSSASKNLKDLNKDNKSMTGPSEHSSPSIRNHLQFYTGKEWSVMEQELGQSVKIRGPVDSQMILHYILFGLIQLISWQIGWIKNFDPAILAPYAILSFSAMETAKIWSNFDPNTTPHIYLSMFPYIIYHIFSREAHTFFTVLWYISLMTANMQDGAPNLKFHVVIGAIIFQSCTLFMYYGMGTPISMPYFRLLKTLDPPMNIRDEIATQISLLLLSIGLYILHTFIKAYALHLFEQETDMNKLKLENERMKGEIRQRKKDVELDTDAPVTKVINILKNIQEQSGSEEVVEALEDAIYVLASNQFYQPNLNFQDDTVDNEINGWLNNLMNYKQPRRNAVLDEGVILGNVNAIAGSLTKIQHDGLAGFDLDSWDFNVFDFGEKTAGRPLSTICRKLFEKYNFCSTFSIEETVLTNFLTKVETAYKSKFYHSVYHAADVVHAVHYFVSQMGLGELMSNEDRLSCIIAAACHDIDHPGVSNVFLINTSHPLALRYNDIAVLENYHAAKTFEILLSKDEDCNILKNLPTDKLKAVRATILASILATDMAVHFEYITKFKNKLVGAGLNVEENQDRQLMIDVMMKCGDISNPSKTPDIAKRWTELIIEEFYLQGDEEKKRGLPISMFMDRNNPNASKCQIGFIDFIVKPLYEPWDSFINEDGKFPGMENIQKNRDYWKKIQDQETAAKAALQSPK